MGAAATALGGLRLFRDGAPLGYHPCSQEEAGVGHGKALGGSGGVLPQIKGPGIGEAMQGGRWQLPC